MPPPPLALGPGLFFCMEGMTYASYFACKDGVNPGVDAHIQKLPCCFQFSELLLFLLLLFQASPVISLSLLLQQCQHQASHGCYLYRAQKPGLYFQPCSSRWLAASLGALFQAEAPACSCTACAKHSYVKSLKMTLHCLCVLAMLTYM